MTGFPVDPNAPAPPVYNFSADLDRMLATRDWSTWNHHALRCVAAGAAGYEPFDNPKILTACARTKAMKLLDAYLTANHHYNLMPDLLMTDYGKTFKRLRRVAYRILVFAKANPQAAIPQQTVAAWMASEGVA